MAQEFKTGDTVKLKSSGPAMTVRETKDDDVTCEWFQDNKIFTHTFKADMLSPHTPYSGAGVVHVSSPDDQRGF